MVWLFIVLPHTFVPPQKSCELHVFLQLGTHNSFGKFHVRRAAPYHILGDDEKVLFVVVIIASHLRGDCMGRDL